MSARRFFIITYLFFQFIIPAFQLFGSYPMMPFGWQMYSRLPESHSQQLRGVNIDGEKIPLKMFPYIVLRRMEIDFPRILPEHICERGLGLAKIETLDSTGRIIRTHQCQ